MSDCQQIPAILDKFYVRDDKAQMLSTQTQINPEVSKSNKLLAGLAAGAWIFQAALNIVCLKSKNIVCVCCHGHLHRRQR